MTYARPLVTKLDTTAETAACQPCMQIGVLTIDRQPSVGVGGNTVGSPCPQTPVPGTPQVGGLEAIDIGHLGDSVGLPQSFGTEVGGVDVAVSL